MSAQQKELLQIEHRKTASSKEMDEEKDRQQVLKNELAQVYQLLREVSVQLVMLTRKKEHLKIDLDRKKLNKQRSWLP